MAGSAQPLSQAAAGRAQAQGLLTCLQVPAGRMARVNTAWAGDAGCGAGKQRTCGRAVCVWLAGLGAAACACAGRRVLLARMREKGLRGHFGESGLVFLIMVR